MVWYVLWSPLKTLLSHPLPNTYRLQQVKLHIMSEYGIWKLKITFTLIFYYFYHILTNYNKSSWLNIMSEVAYSYWKKIKAIHRFHKLMFYSALNVQPSLWQLVLVRYRTRGKLLFSLLRLTRRDIKKQKTKKNNNKKNQKNKKQKTRNIFVDHWLSLWSCLLAIVLSVLQFAAFDCYFGIFELFLINHDKSSNKLQTNGS